MAGDANTTGVLKFNQINKDPTNAQGKGSAVNVANISFSALAAFANTDDVIVEVNVVDVNDNVPILSDFKLVLNNFKNYFPLGPVARVPVFDADVNDQVG